MSNEIIPINGSQARYTDHRYVLCFGAYSWTRLMVWANSLEDALDACVDWIAENAPGLLCDESVAEEYHRAIAEGLGEEEAQERAEEDMILAGDCGHYLASWEVAIVAEDPTRAEILELQGRKVS